MTARRTLPLLELDPDLGQLLSEDRLRAAQAELHVEMHRLPAGPWSGGRVEGTNPEHVGLLIVDGIVARDVLVADTVSTELLGPGDMLRPWSLQDGAALLQLEVRWNALTETRVAILDRRFGLHLAQWPEVNAVLIDRINQRAQRIAITQAISQLNRVDRRLLALFWHFAERFGRVTSDGVAVPLTLSHRMLGQLVGARRPTVSSAIADLAERDELIRRSDGSWLLKGDPVGVPAGEAQRMIPIRRKLIGTLADEPVEISDEAATAAAELDEHPVVLTALDELRNAMAKVREETSQRVVRTRELAEANERLRQEIASRRAELDAAREHRRLRRSPASFRGNGRP